MRNGAICHVIEQADQRYTLNDFAHLLPRASPPPCRPRPRSPTNHRLNPALIDAITAELVVHYDGFAKPNGYIAARCPLGHHTIDHAGNHFNFDPVRGCGVCFGRHGTANLRDLCDALGLYPEDYGGIYLSKAHI